MTIMDKRFGSEIVTDKGKAYKYCSIECMVREYNRDEKINANAENFFANDYEEPGFLTDATKLHYIISENMPSPMGEGLNAFANKDKAQFYQEKNTGTLYNWEKLKEIIR